MRLVYPEMEIDLLIQELEPLILVVENPIYFTDMTETLWNQINGQDGKWILSDNGKTLKIDKKVDFIINPFSVTSNDRKILNKIYSELNAVALENYMVELSRVNAQIISLLDIISQTTPYPMVYNLDMDLTGIFKLYDVKVEEECTSLMEKLLSYIKLRHQVTGIDLFVFLNLKQYFSVDQIELLYEGCRYEQVGLLDIENHQYNYRLNSEKYLIIDEDLCIIRI